MRVDMTAVILEVESSSPLVGCGICGIGYVALSVLKPPWRLGTAGGYLSQSCHCCHGRSFNVDLCFQLFQRRTRRGSWGNHAAC